MPLVTRAEARLLPSLLAVSEPAARRGLIKLLDERDTMSEQKSGFLSTLDAWTDEHVILPLYEVVKAYYEAPEDIRHNDAKYDEALWHMDSSVNKAIREKVLESYHNGKAVPAQKGGAWKRG